MGFWNFLKAKIGIGYQRNVNIHHIDPDKIKKGDCKKIGRKKWLCKKDDGSLQVCDVKKMKCKKVKEEDI